LNAFEREDTATQVEIKVGLEKYGVSARVLGSEMGNVRSKTEGVVE
jgi:hypothetical protein